MTAPGRQLRRGEEIDAPELLLIGLAGERLGVVKVADARAEARRQSCELVEVAPNASPPVCRLYLPGEAPAERAPTEAARETRVVRFMPDGPETDFRLKIRHCVAFLSEGGAVEVRVPEKTRARLDREAARTLVLLVADALSGSGARCSEPRRERNEWKTVLTPGGDGA